MSLSTEFKTGADCSGTTGQTGRVLTLANTSLTQSAGFLVFVNGAVKILTTDYTVSHLVASSTVTFIGAINDADTIVVEYNQVGGTSATARYCSTSDVYLKTGLSTTEVAALSVESLIVDAEYELDSVAGRAFTNANQITEYLSIKDKDVIGKAQTTIVLSKHPIQSISLFNQVDVNDSAIDTYATLTGAQIIAGTFATDDYWLQTMNDPLTNIMSPNGKIILKTDSFPKGTNNVKITYTYGYASVPNMIKNLAVCLAGIRTWLAFMGCGYNRLNSYSIPQQSVNKGDFYQRGMQNIQLLTDEANRLFDRIGRKPRTLFFSSGGAR